ncbi:MAG: hypothetical protein N3A38_05925 [Planctomycetota bacterium]|nr:hypothetical protein [Planctomycetota bacterium]
MESGGPQCRRGARRVRGGSRRCCGKISGDWEPYTWEDITGAAEGRMGKDRVGRLNGADWSGSHGGSK